MDAYPTDEYDYRPSDEDWEARENDRDAYLEDQAIFRDIEREEAKP